MVYPRFVLAAAAGAALMLGIPSGALAANQSGAVLKASAKRVQVVDSAKRAHTYRAKGSKLRFGAKVRVVGRGKHVRLVRRGGHVRSIQVRGIAVRANKIRLDDGTTLDANGFEASAGDEVVVTVEPDPSGTPVVTDTETPAVEETTQAPASSSYEGWFSTADPSDHTFKVRNEDSTEFKTFKATDALWAAGFATDLWTGGHRVKVTYHDENGVNVADAVEANEPPCVPGAPTVTGDNVSTGIFAGGDFNRILIRDDEYHYTEFAGPSSLLGGKVNLGGGRIVSVSWHDEGGTKVADAIDVAPEDACING